MLYDLQSYPRFMFLLIQGALADRFFDIHYITYSQVFSLECVPQNVHSKCVNRRVSFVRSE